MVEAPGYCPPGPKCLFHLTFYRHSRLPGTDLDREFAAQSQGFPALAPAPLNAKASGKAGLTPVMARSTIKTFRGFKRMKKLVFVVAGAALGLSACNSNNQDQVNNAELNQPAAEDLNQAALD